MKTKNETTPKFALFTSRNGKFSVREIGVQGFMFDLTDDKALMERAVERLNNSTDYRQKGWNAFFEGENLADCPFINEPAALWEAGWLAAKDSI